MGTYPADLERPGLLKDGRSVLIRPIRPEDTDQMLEMYGRLSRQSISYRFLGPVVTIRREAMRKFTEIDYLDNLALVAVLGERILGVARMVRSEESPDRAEVTFLIEDSFQGQGLGGLLLEHIAPAARERGISVLEADVLADNTRMVSAFMSSGYRYEMSGNGSVIHFDVGIDPRVQAIARGQRRDHLATRSSLVPLMTPRSAVVVGASDRPMTIGSAITNNLVDRFAGELYLVNPKVTTIAGHPALSSVRDIPEPVDLAVIAVPAADVLDVLADCAAREVKVAVIVSIGFSESGAEGAARERELVRFARQHGMRILGPNCMGVVNNLDTTTLAATFAPSLPGFGPVSMSSQSGSIGLALLDRAGRYHLGCSAFVSIGNAADIGTNDLLQWWDEDPTTKVVLLHADRFDNPREFTRLARRIGPRKPLVVVHPGIAHPTETDPSALEEAPPTEAPRPPSLTSDSVLGQLFRQAGIIRAYRQEQLFDLGLVLANQPVPEGDRVAIVTNGAGPGLLTAGACRASGLQGATLTDATRERLSALLPPNGGISDVIDLTPVATPQMYAEILDAVLSDTGVDAAIVVFVPPLVTQSEAVAAAIRAASGAHPTKTVLASFLGDPGIPDALHDDAVSVPSFTFPETAAATLGLVAEYGRWRRQPAGLQPHLSGIRSAQARTLIEDREPGPLADAGAVELLGHYGLAVGPEPEEDSTHDPGASHVGGGPDGSVVRIELVSDPTFGPVLTLGLAGPYVELFGDLAFRITPLSDRDAAEMIRSLRSYPLLAGTYGPARDLEALRDVLLRVSAMVEDLPELRALSLTVRLEEPGAGAIVAGATAVLDVPDHLRVPMETAVLRHGVWSAP